MPISSPCCLRRAKRFAARTKAVDARPFWKRIFPSSAMMTSIIGLSDFHTFLYPAAFPLVTLLILWKCLSKSRKGNSEKEPDPLARGLRFFYENYSGNCWFWEIVELARKVLLTSALLLTDAQSRTYIGSAPIISGLYTVLFACYKPITDSFEHWLQLISLMASSVNFSVGMLLKVWPNIRIPVIFIYDYFFCRILGEKISFRCINNIAFPGESSGQDNY